MESEGWIDVEVFSLREPARRLSRLSTFLSPDESERAARFRSARDRDRFIAGRGRLREMLGARLGSGPAALEFGYGVSGKPFLLNPACDARLSFNLAHSGDTAILAVSDGRRVGVDIEGLQALPRLEEVARSAFSEAERAALQQVPWALKVRAFYHCWTRREAYVKALGDGFPAAPDSFEVTVDPRMPARIITRRGRGDDQCTWTLVDLPVGRGFVAALVFEGGAPRICWVDGREGNASVAGEETSREQ